MAKPPTVTPAQIDAGREAVGGSLGPAMSDGLFVAIYRAMLAAAPAPDVERVVEIARDALGGLSRIEERRIREAMQSQEDGDA